MFMKQIVIAIIFFSVSYLFFYFCFHHELFSITYKFSTVEIGLTKQYYRICVHFSILFEFQYLFIIKMHLFICAKTDHLSPGQVYSKQHYR